MQTKQTNLSMWRFITCLLFLGGGGRPHSWHSSGLMESRSGSVYLNSCFSAFGWLNAMATYCDEPVDSYFYSSYNPYIGRYPRPKDAGWKYKSYLSHYGDTSEAFSNQQRAQLKSILSQINPKLTPRLRKANTKDVAVQVNPKTDASVQCSIGPRTLLAMKRDFRRRRKPETATPVSPKAAVGVRYPRNLAVYSPISFRSVTSFLVDENNNRVGSCGEAQTGEPSGGPPEPGGESDGKKSDPNQAGKDGETAKLTEPRKLPKQKCQDAQTAKGLKGKAPVRFQVRHVSRQRGRGL